MLVTAVCFLFLVAVIILLIYFVFTALDAKNVTGEVVVCAIPRDPVFPLCDFKIKVGSILSIGVL